MLIVVFLLLFFAFFLIPVKFRIHYLKTGKQDTFILEMSFFYELLKMKYTGNLLGTNQYGTIMNEKFFNQILFFKQKNEKGTSSPPKESFKQIKTFYSSYRRFGLGIALMALFLPAKYSNLLVVFNNMERKGKITNFYWYSRLGLGDPSGTGMAASLLWILKANLIRYLEKHIGFGDKKPVIMVEPYFYRTSFDTLFECIFEVKLGYIIFVSLFNRLKYNYFERKEVVSRE